MEINNYDLPFDKVICHLLALGLGEGGVRHLVHKASHSQGIKAKSTWHGERPRGKYRFHDDDIIQYIKRIRLRTFNIPGQ
jgi:hypothetical protein